jgi:hypothetical protein
MGICKHFFKGTQTVTCSYWAARQNYITAANHCKQKLDTNAVTSHQANKFQKYSAVSQFCYNNISCKLIYFHNRQFTSRDCEFSIGTKDVTFTFSLSIIFTSWMVECSLQKLIDSFVTVVIQQKIKSLKMLNING